MEIRKIDSWDEYQKAWEKCAEDLPWVKEDKLLFLNKKEELEDLEQAFQNPDNIFLVASISKNDYIIGCLSILVRGKNARIGRWEPVILAQHKNTVTKILLLEKAIELLKERGIETLGTTLKYEIDDPDVALELLNLLESFGFDNRIPPAIQLFQDLTKYEDSTKVNDTIKIKTRDTFTISDFCKFAQLAFATLKEDKKMHGWDAIVSDYDTCMKFNKFIIDGNMGFSPEDFWLVATIENSPAGYLLAYAPNRKDGLKLGMIGELGVLPDYRSKGAASTLINEILKKFKENNYEYTYVGTLDTNIGAIKVYEKNGFIQLHRVLFLSVKL
ncbi:MAG: GNAT family N-acetyltransferase [Candidatus Heimdallarchaeota archaeon]